MQKLILLFSFLLISTGALAQADTSAFAKFNDFNNAVLNGGIKKAEAQKQFESLLKYISFREKVRNEGILPKGNWVFPLKGYKSNAIGGSHGNGYFDKGYRYLDGNKHGAHPAHDIFINDKNQDCMDDHTGKPVDVVSVDDGWVVACTNQWEPHSNMRGGKFIWIYHPASNVFTYYAHNNQIFVIPGEQVKQGQKIAEVGRTGYNAYKKRSPTHLHFSEFKLVDDIPVPFNPYEQLKKAKTL
ncbi:Peptidase family M23 [Mucilaginibacter gossypiicola]|uniref:Peptidase family M23 n=1 Tax=Mucilaginibacter gossypiicola TaxID=551995 RepID=A0A1H8MPZ1_9SPHI|nr:M23 family metallopeptidase [Mucilaginibacter gossypiicola]SEO19294.1 Peptidase family M23 [Mucilaginibacter gossypiicola]